MDPACRFKTWSPCFIPFPHHHHYHHHHHHHHHHYHDHHHHHHHHGHHCRQLFLCPRQHRHVCPSFPSFTRNQEEPPIYRDFRNDVVNVETSQYPEAADSSAPPLLLEQEEEEEDEPVFVLTDEWRDFFAKSEAKRKLEKKLAKKGKKL